MVSIDKDRQHIDSDKIFTPVDGEDRLSSMYKYHNQFFRIFFDRKKVTPKYLNQWAKDLFICIVVEAVEFLNEFSWKHWSKKIKKLAIEQIKYECVDMLLFIFCKMYALGMTEEEIYQMTMRKIAINFERQKNGY